jgi:rfaE bifunctional protein kinase chain/domain
MNAPQTARDWLNGLKGKRILVIGDVMLDAYIWGRVERISPEAPVPVVEMEREESRLGGAANVARNLGALGMVPLLVGVVGQDDQADTLRHLMQEAGLPTNGILTDGSRPTCTKTRVLGGTQQILRIDRESTRQLSPELEAELIQRVNQLLAEGVQAVIFEDYDKGLLSPSVIAPVVEKARETGTPVLVDPKFRNFFAYAGVTVFKPNLKELASGLNVQIARGDMASVRAAVDQLRQRMPHQLSLVTLSEQGMMLVGEALEGGYLHIPAHVRRITDVSGAGDTVISVFAAAMGAGLSPGLSMALANLAGGLVCEIPGVVPIDPDRLAAEAENLKLF